MPVHRQGAEIKVFVTGATGQLGYDCVRELLLRGHDVIGSGSRACDNLVIFLNGTVDHLDHDVVKAISIGEHEAIESVIPAANIDVSNGLVVLTVPYVRLDITNQADVADTIEKIKPDAIIHCAAWTAVDAAEEEENKAKVHAINVDGTRYIAEAAKTVGAKMLYLSTDYVFDGRGNSPWQPDDKNYAPLNFYGQTKLEGEIAVASLLKKYYIVRIAWVFGLNGKNFIKTMINVGKTKHDVRVVDDQIGTPTYTYDLARLLVDMIETDKYGYYHATNEGGYISWADLAEESFRSAGLTTKVIRVTTVEYGLSKAARPENSRLDKSKLEKMGFKPLPDWKDAVARYIEEAGLKNG